MNDKPYSILPFILSVIILMLTSSCEKECRLTHEKLLTEQQKKQIPFKGKEIITFNSGQNNIELIGTDRIDTFEKIYPSGFSCDYYIEESEFITFESEDYKLRLRMTDRDEFYISVIDFVQNLKMYASMRTTPATGELTEYTKFIDSLIINNLMYLNIYKDTIDLSYLFKTRDSEIYATYIYYSTEYGVVRIDFSDSTSWELVHIDWNE
jgi:hypothetical protein